MRKLFTNKFFISVFLLLFVFTGNSYSQQPAAVPEPMGESGKRVALEGPGDPAVVNPSMNLYGILSFPKPKLLIIFIMVNNIQNECNNLNFIAFQCVKHSPVVRQVYNKQIVCIIFLPVFFWNQILFRVFSIERIINNNILNSFFVNCKSISYCLKNL